MTTNHDALREAALKAADEVQKLIDQRALGSPAHQILVDAVRGLAASKPEQQAQCVECNGQGWTTQPDPRNGDACQVQCESCLGTGKPQAQAEPEVATCCGHASDCAVHNAPALPAGPCDCGVEPVIVAWLNTKHNMAASVVEVRRKSEEVERSPAFIAGELEPLITLQSHREAIAKKDAALDVALEALEASTDQTVETDKFFEMVGDAITKIKEARVLKGGGV